MRRDDPMRVKYAEAYTAERELWKRVIREMAAEIRELKRKLSKEASQK